MGGRNIKIRGRGRISQEKYKNNTILTFPNSNQVRKWTKRMAKPTFNSITRTIMIELGP